jgi:hypothetical protein
MPRVKQSQADDPDVKEQVKKNELQKLKNEEEKLKRDGKMARQSEWIAFYVARAAGFGAILLGGSEFVVPDFLIGVALDASVAATIAGSGLAFLGGPKIKTWLSNVARHLPGA